MGQILIQILISFAVTKSFVGVFAICRFVRRILRAEVLLLTQEHRGITRRPQASMIAS